VGGGSVPERRKGECTCSDNEHALFTIITTVLTPDS